jgi:hypothetical protein
VISEFSHPGEILGCPVLTSRRHRSSSVSHENRRAPLWWARGCVNGPVRLNSTQRVDAARCAERRPDFRLVNRPSINDSPHCPVGTRTF